MRTLHGIMAPGVVLVSVLLEAGCAVGPAASRENPNLSLAPGARTSCVAALDALRATFERDYPGYKEKVAGREGTLAGRTDSVRVEAARSDDHTVSIPALWRWAAFFGDPHVMIWQAAPPAPHVESDTSAGEARPIQLEAPLRPSLRFVDDSTAVLRLPSFEMGYKVAIDSLVEEARGRLLATPYLVVDVRQNGGGYTGSFDAVLPLLASGPIVRPGADLWTSAANVAFVRGWLTDRDAPADFRAQIQAVLPVLEARPDQFVPFAPNNVVSFGEPSTLPRAVGVLVDRGCASSCENFVLDARQSRKVTVFGAEHTRGMVDYGNVRAAWLPGWRRLRIPTSRSRRLPAEPLDNVGIAPGVWLPPGTPDAVEAVRCLLRGHEGCPQALPPSD